MANEEHLARLIEGVDPWNRWRKKKEVQIDLSGVNLSGLDLHGINFNGVNLQSANFSGAKLRNADLRNANLNGANLSGVNLSGFNLSGVNLSHANLSKALLNDVNLKDFNLSGVNFSYADLSGTILSGTNLSGAILYGIDLSGFNLSDTVLNKVNLSRCNLSSTNFSGADLSYAVLSDANLKNANLSNTSFNNTKLNNVNLSDRNLSGLDLSYADLRNAVLRASQLLESNLTSATLTGACIQDWNINSATKLDGVICEYVYLKGEWSYKEWKYIFSDRRPRNPDSIFAPGEFAKLFQKALETIDLIFVDGIDWKAFFQSFQELRSQYDDENLSIQAIEKKSGGAFVIRLEVPPEADKAAIEKQAKELYERDRQLLEAQYQYQLQAKDVQITIYQEWLNTERQSNTDLTGIVKTMADKETANVTQHFHASVTGVAGNVEGDQNIYTSPEKQSLAEAAAEIQKLLKQLEQNNPTATDAEKQAFVSIAIPPTLRQRAVSALQSGGKTAIEEFLDNPYVNVAIAIIEGWRSAEK